MVVQEQTAATTRGEQASVTSITADRAGGSTQHAA